MSVLVHVFVGCFSTRDEACGYTEPQWEPEPPESVSDEAYRDWENRNPTWRMKSELEVAYLDSDFIETIDGDNRYEYLGNLLTEPSAIERIRKMADAGDNILVLIFATAFGGFPASPKSTPRLKYCGQYGFTFRDGPNE